MDYNYSQVRHYWCGKEGTSDKFMITNEDGSREVFKSIEDEKVECEYWTSDNESGSYVMIDPLRSIYSDHIPYLDNGRLLHKPMAKGDDSYIILADYTVSFHTLFEKCLLPNIDILKNLTLDPIVMHEYYCIPNRNQVCVVDRDNNIKHVFKILYNKYTNKQLFVHDNFEECSTTVVNVTDKEHLGDIIEIQFWNYEDISIPLLSRRLVATTMDHIPVIGAFNYGLMVDSPDNEILIVRKPDTVVYWYKPIARYRDDYDLPDDIVYMDTVDDWSKGRDMTFYRHVYWDKDGNMLEMIKDRLSKLADCEV